MPSVLGMTQSSFDPASRVRFIQYMPYLRERGWDVTHRPNRPDRQWYGSFRNRWARSAQYRAGRLALRANRMADVWGAADYDAVFVNRDLAGKGLAAERLLRRRNPRFVFDFDDAIFMGNEKSISWTCANAAWVTPGNPYLAKWAAQFTDRLTVIPTVIDVDRYVVQTDGMKAPSGPVRVGWSGSNQSIRGDLFPFLEMLGSLQKRLGFELVIVSNSKPELPVAGLQWQFVPWKADDEGRIAERFDIGVMPLEDREFQRGKCGMKLLQYMAAGIATIASPVGVNAEIVEPGSSGFLASAPADWAQALEKLVRDGGARRAIGQRGRKVCEERYSIRRWVPELDAILRRVAGARGERLTAPRDAA